MISKDNDIYKLQDEHNKKTLTRHVNDLRTCRFESTQSNPTINLIRHWPLMLTLIALLATISVAQHTFDRVRPIIWLTTKYNVNLGTAYYDINFIYTNPCDIWTTTIRNNGPDITNNTSMQLDSDTIKRMEEFDKKCNKFYTLEWDIPMTYLLNAKIPDRKQPNFKIDKRELLKRARFLEPEESDVDKYIKTTEGKSWVKLSQDKVTC